MIDRCGQLKLPSSYRCGSPVQTSHMPKSLAEHLSEVRRATPVGDRDAQANATAPINDHVDLREYRPITPQEKTILTAMLHSSGPAAIAFLPQLEGMMVKNAECPCGCPTLSFAPPPEELRISYRANLVSEMYGYTTNGLTDVANIYVHIMLHQAGGKLRGLEVYDLAGNLENYTYPLPTPEALLTAEQARTNTPSTHK